MGANKLKPLVIQQVFKDMYQKSKVIARDNSDIITMTSDLQRLIVRFRDVDESEFFFEFGEPAEVKSGTIREIRVNFSRFPANSDKPETTGFNGLPEEVMRSLEGWIAILKQFNDFSYESEDDIAKHYADKYYIEHRSTDSDAEIMPFEDDRQEAIIRLLGHIVDALAQLPDPEAQEISKI